MRVFEKGVAIYPGVGTKDGVRGDHVIVSPAYTVEEEDLEKVVKTMRKVYDEMELEYENGGLKV
jgi:adenosylmethionine-8-amino-7-oxononanoate aminotransferase